MRRFRVVIVRAVALLWVTAIVATSATPAFAGSSGITSSDRRVSVSGDITVARGEVVTGPVATIDGSVFIRGTVTDYVVVGEGDLVVSGRVTRGVVVVHGDARISGRVRGDVVALTGRVTVTSDGQVDGDVVSRRRPSIARGTVAGDVRRVDLRAIFTGIIIGFLAYLWLAVTLSMAIFGLLFVWLLPRAADTAAAAGKRVAASIGWGALVGLVGPILAVLVLVTVLGLPLGFTMLSGLNVLAPLGYVTASLILGRVWVKGTTPRARIGAFFAGFGILRLVAIIPGIGLLAWFLVCVYGIGAVSMAAWYGGHQVRPPPPEDEAAPLEPPTSEPPPEPPEPPSEPPAPPPEAAPPEPAPTEPPIAWRP
jgi:hypothetical protein